MRDPTNRDRLIVKLFYTACCLSTGAVAVVRIPNVLGVAYVAITFFVLLPIWTPYVRRQYSGSPHDLLEAPRMVWAFLAPFAATFVLLTLLALPTSYLFGLFGTIDRIAWAVVLAATGLIVILTWQVAVDSDLVPPWEPGAGPPPKKKGALSD